MALNLRQDGFWWRHVYVLPKATANLFGSRLAVGIKEEMLHRQLNLTTLCSNKRKCQDIKSGTKRPRIEDVMEATPAAAGNSASTAVCEQWYLAYLLHLLQSEPPARKCKGAKKFDWVDYNDEGRWWHCTTCVGVKHNSQSFPCNRCQMSIDI